MDRKSCYECGAALALAVMALSPSIYPALCAECKEKHEQTHHAQEEPPRADFYPMNVGGFSSSIFGATDSSPSPSPAPEGTN